MDSLTSLLFTILLSIAFITTDNVWSAPVSGHTSTPTQSPFTTHKIESGVVSESEVSNGTEEKGGGINEEKVSYKEFEIDNGGSVESNSSPNTEESRPKCTMSKEEMREMTEKINSVEEIADYLYRTKDYKKVACLFQTWVDSKVMSEASANAFESEVVKQLWSKLQNVVVVQDEDASDYQNPDYRNAIDYDDYKIVQKIFDQGIEELLYELLYSLYMGSVTGDGDLALGNFVRLIASEVATNGISPVEGKELIDYIFSDRLTTQSPIPLDEDIFVMPSDELAHPSSDELVHELNLGKTGGESENTKAFDEIEQELQKEVQSNSREQDPTALQKGLLGGATIDMQQLFHSLQGLSPEELYRLKEKIDTQSYDEDEKFRIY